MGKPILGNPVLRGDAAKELEQYLAAARPDPEKEKAYRQGLPTHKRVSK